MGQQIGVSGTDGCPPNYGNEHLHFERRVRDFSCEAEWRSADPLPVLTSSNANGGPPPSVSFNEGDTLEVVDGPLNLRSGPGLSYFIIATMPNGRNAITLQGPDVADGYHWYRIDTRDGRGWAAGEYLGAASFNNVLANPTANANLSNIYPNRSDSSEISRAYVDNNWRVEVVNDGVNPGEGVRYDSNDLNWPGQHWFGGIVHHLKRVPGSNADLHYIRTTVFYTDGTNEDSGAVGLTLDDTWQTVVLKTIGSNPNKTVEKVGLRVTRQTAAGASFSFYSDNARIVQL
jgi:hypothetical protein